MSYLVYGVLGASFLWPWNSLITAAALARDRLAENAALFASYSSIVMTASTVTSLMATTYLAYHPENYSKRVIRGELVVIATFLLLVATSNILKGGLWLTLVASCFVAASVGTSFIQNGALAITQRIPDAGHTLALMNGQAVTGVLAPFLPLFAMGVSPNLLSTFTFLSVVVLSIAAAVLFNSRGNTEFRNMAEDARKDDDVPPSWQKLYDLAKEASVPVISLLLAFIVSLSYPVFANTVESRTLGIAYYSPITHIVWNVGDLTGRVACMSTRLRITNGKTMISYAILRGFLVLALVIIAKMGNPSDIIYWLVMLAYGATSGHLVSSAITLAPTCVSTELQPATGGLLGMVIAIGLLMGSLASFIIVLLL